MSVVQRAQASEVEMIGTSFYPLRNVCAALALAMWGALPCVGQTNKMADKMADERALKTTAMKARAVADPTIESLIDQGRLPEARAKLREQFAKEGERPRLLLCEAMILYREQQYAASLRKLERSLSQHDGDADVHKLVGLNLVSVGKADVAAPYFARAVELAPGDFMARYYLGLSQLTSKQFAAAETTVRAALQLNPNYVDTWLLLGVAQEQLGKEAEALQTYRQAIELTERQSRQSEKPYLYLARLLLSLQQFEPSLSPLRRAIAINPQASEAFTLQGRALSRLEQYEESLRVLQEAVRLAPQDKMPHYLLMGVYQKLGKRTEAQREMQLFRALEEQEKQP
ncbi:MAG TPA: tetratricopeptide repeat protein [Blastocatellia bacterium]|nr:tetratricopeptide repeat protein [Blastocatellia bacterium]